MSTRKRIPEPDRPDEALIPVARVVYAPETAEDEMPRGDMEGASFAAAVFARAADGMPHGEMADAPEGAGEMPDGAMNGGEINGGARNGGGMPGHAFAAEAGGMPDGTAGAGEMPGEGGAPAGGGEMPGHAFAAGRAGEAAVATGLAGFEIGGEWRLVLTTAYARPRADG
jgi:hypothetical protein